MNRAKEREKKGISNTACISRRVVHSLLLVVGSHPLPLEAAMASSDAAGAAKRVRDDLAYARFSWFHVKVRKGAIALSGRKGGGD